MSSPLRSKGAVPKASAIDLCVCWGWGYANLAQMTAKVVAGYWKAVPGKKDGALEIQTPSAGGDFLRKDENYTFTWKPRSK